MASRLSLLRDLDHALGDQRARDAGAEEILALVNRAGLDHREDEVRGEFLLEIIDVDFGCAGLHRFFVEAFEFLLLADVGAEGDHLRVVFFLDPGQQHRGVEAAGVCENDFHIDLNLPANK